MLRTTSYLALNAVTSTTTSDPINISGARRVGFLFTRANHTAGSSTFTVGLSLQPESTAAANVVTVASNMLIDNVTNTNVQNLTRVASKALASNTSVLVWLDPACVATFVTVTATIDTDGNGTCRVIAEYDTPA